MAEQSKDWASRRKHAMNRARELRSRIKEAEHIQDSGSSDVSSLASKSEIQRQRRSRQLEATQRLLDGQAGGFNFNETSSGMSVGSKSFVEEGRMQKGIPDNKYEGSARTGREASSVQSRYNHDEQPVGRSGSHARKDVSETNHSIISQKHLGHIHKRYPKPTENDSLASKLDHHTRSSHYKEENYVRSMHGKDIGSANKFRSTPSDTILPEDTIKHSLRERPLEGRGRGRGRGRSTPSSGGTSSLGELSQSSKSLSRPSAVAKDQIIDARSRSHHSTTRINSSSSRPSQFKQATVDDSEALQSYLRGRRVPDYKEGECEKLAVLRQRLVARRRKRELTSQNGKENTKPEPTSVTKSGSSAEVGVKTSSKGMSSLERLDPNEYTARDFQNKSEKPKHGYNDDMASLPRHHELEDHHFREPHSMDKSPMSPIQHINDDESSVVDIELIQCDCCKRSFAPKIYAKHFDDDGQPKCANNIDKKRPLFNSAKARIANNSNLNKDEQMQALQVNKKVTKELSRKVNGKASKKRSKKSNKWREESMNFREAMKANRLIAKAEKEGKPAHYYLS